MGIPARTGCSRSGPVIDMPPPVAWATWSKAGRRRPGPLAPNPVTVQAMMRGLTAQSDA